MNIEGRRKNDGPATRWVGFQVAGQHYALDILQVMEVLSPAPIEPVPGAPPAVLGVINLRGRIVAAVDVRRCLGHGACEGHDCMIVVDSGGELLVLCVDRIVGIHRITDAAVAAVPAMGSAAGSPLQGIYSRNGLILSLLDAGRLAAIAAHAA